ncbi:MAG TPA: helix-turn-helix domain-containing protein [Solirubrobacterales bacterium]|nr:helix-turn-helix domain-containing protein [Solirubrobacterales bacterium]
MAGLEDCGKREDREDHYRCAAVLHPLRGQILRLMLGGRERSIADIAAELAQPLGRIGYHLRVLKRRDALKARSGCGAGRPLYRWAPQAHWARKMLDEIDARNAEDE